MRPDYSTAAAEYDRYRSFPPEAMKKYIDTFIDMADLRGGERLLDGGAGTGRFSLPLSERFRVTALDCSREMIEQGRGKSRKVKWVQGDLARTPFKAKRFDCCLLAYAIHQVADFTAVIEEMHRLSRKCVIVTTDMRSRIPTLLDRAFPGVVRADRERFPPIEELEGAFILTGYDRVRARRILLEGRVSKREYLEKVKHRYLSSFDLISQEEYEAGVRKLEEILAAMPGEDFVSRVLATFVSASKR